MTEFELISEKAIHEIDRQIISLYDHKAGKAKIDWAKEVRDSYVNSKDLVLREFPKQIVANYPLLKERMTVMNQLYHQSWEDAIEGKIPYGDYSKLDLNSTPLFNV